MARKELAALWSGPLQQQLHVLCTWYSNSLPKHGVGHQCTESQPFSSPGHRQLSRDPSGRDSRRQISFLHSPAAWSTHGTAPHQECNCSGTRDTKTNGSSPGWVIIFGLCNPNTLLLDQEQTQASNWRHYCARSGEETETCRRNRTDVLSWCIKQVRLHTCWTSGNTNNSIGFQAIRHITQRCRQLYHI